MADQRLGAHSVHLARRLRRMMLALATHLEFELFGDQIREVAKNAPDKDCAW